MSETGTMDKYKLGFLSVDTSAVFVCDLQEKFRKAISHFPEIITTGQKVLSASNILGIPVVVTEQYPQGLGATVSELDTENAVGIISKTKFSMVVPEVTELLNSSKLNNVKAVILFGIEAHVCVEQTAIDLLSQGIFVHVVADATSSRSQEDRILALNRLNQIGCFVTTSESVIFKLIGDKNHPKFNDIRNLVKSPSPMTGLWTSKM